MDAGVCRRNCHHRQFRDDPRRRYPGVGNKPALTTTLPWRDILTRLWLLDPVAAWLPTNNRLTELASSDKHHFCRPRTCGPASQRHCNRSDLGSADHAVNSAQRSIPRRALREPPGTQPARICPNGRSAGTTLAGTQRGEHEVDFIVIGPDDGIVAIEAKLSATVVDSDVKHLRWLRDRIGDRLLDAVVVTTGTQAYRRADGIAVVPAALLGPRWPATGRPQASPVHLAKRGLTFVIQLDAPSVLWRPRRALPSVLGEIARRDRLPDRTVAETRERSPDDVGPDDAPAPHDGEISDLIVSTCAIASSRVTGSSGIRADRRTQRVGPRRPVSRRDSYSCRDRRLSGVESPIPESHDAKRIELERVGLHTWTDDFGLHPLTDPRRSHPGLLVAIASQ